MRTLKRAFSQHDMLLRRFSRDYSRIHSSEILLMKSFSFRLSPFETSSSTFQSDAALSGRDELPVRAVNSAEAGKRGQKSLYI